MTTLTDSQMIHFLLLAATGSVAFGLLFVASYILTSILNVLHEDVFKPAAVFLFKQCKKLHKRMKS